MSFDEKLQKALFKSKRLLKKQSPTILTIVGVGGVALTAVLTVKATIKAVDILEEAKKEKNEELTKTEIVKAAGPVYIPAAVAGVATAVCIVSANILNKKQQASLMGGYVLLEQSFKEYKNKVKELHGEEGHDKVVEEIAKDHYPRRGYICSGSRQAALL